MKYSEKEMFMALALKEAKKALNKKEVPVGCVIVKNGEIIAKGYNLRETKQNSLLHAEIITIDKACNKLSNFRLEDCDIYVTLEPCLMCSGAIIQSRIKNLYFGAYDTKYGAVKSVAHVMEIPSNHSVNIEGGVLEEKCSNIIKEFFKELRENKKKNK